MSTIFKKSAFLSGWFEMISNKIRIIPHGGKSKEIGVSNLRSNARTLESPWSPGTWCCFHKELQECSSTFHRQGKIVPLDSWLKPKKPCRAEGNPPRLQQT